MFHFFPIDDLKLAIPADYLIACADDDGDGQADDGILEWARQTAEDEVISYVEASPEGYDSDDWQVDANADGISDNINGLIKSLTLDVAIYKIARRRNEVPDNIQRMYADAIAQLIRIRSGEIILVNATVRGEVASNMKVGDLGRLTEDDEALQWSEMQ